MIIVIIYYSRLLIHSISTSLQIFHLRDSLLSDCQTWLPEVPLQVHFKLVDQEKHLLHLQWSCCAHGTTLYLDLHKTRSGVCGSVAAGVSRCTEELQLEPVLTPGEAVEMKAHILLVQHLDVHPNYIFI